MEAKKVTTAMFVSTRDTAKARAAKSVPNELFQQDMQKYSIRQQLLAVMEGMKPGEAQGIKMEAEDDYRKWLAHAHANVRRYLGWGRYAVRYKLMVDNEGAWFCILRKPVPGKVNGKTKAAA